MRRIKDLEEALSRAEASAAETALRFERQLLLAHDDRHSHMSEAATKLKQVQGSTAGQGWRLRVMRGRGAAVWVMGQSEWACDVGGCFA